MSASAEREVLPAPPTAPVMPSIAPDRVRRSRLAPAWARVVIAGVVMGAIAPLAVVPPMVEGPWSSIDNPLPIAVALGFWVSICADLDRPRPRLAVAATVGAAYGFSILTMMTLGGPMYSFSFQVPHWVNMNLPVWAIVGLPALGALLGTLEVASRSGSKDIWLRAIRWGGVTTVGISVGVELVSPFAKGPSREIGQILGGVWIGAVTTAGLIAAGAPPEA